MLYKGAKLTLLQGLLRLYAAVMVQQGLVRRWYFRKLASVLAALCLECDFFLSDERRALSSCFASFGSLNLI